jgi:hypothetical protein
MTAALTVWVSVEPATHLVSDQANLLLFYPVKSASFCHDHETGTIIAVRSKWSEVFRRRRRLALIVALGPSQKAQKARFGLAQRPAGVTVFVIVPGIALIPSNKKSDKGMFERGLGSLCNPHRLYSPEIRALVSTCGSGFSGFWNGETRLPVRLRGWKPKDMTIPRRRAMDNSFLL